jgi:hypothetical protein
MGGRRTQWRIGSSRRRWAGDAICVGATAERDFADGLVKVAVAWAKIGDDCVRWERPQSCVRVMARLGIFRQVVAGPHPANVMADP